MLDMIIASFLKIWHIIPIIIAIILFRKFLNSKDRKRRIQINEQKQKDGLSLQLRVGKQYEDLAYEVLYKKAQDIDVYCFKENKVLLVKCNNATEVKSITSENINTFIDNALSYLKENKLEGKNVELRYAVLYPAVFDKTAMKLLSDDKNNCKYIVI